MKTFGAILLVLLFYGAWKYAQYQWTEWGGAFGRWGRGEPLRQSEFLSQQWQAKQEQYRLEKAEYRRSYQQNHSLILNPAFRRQFREFGLHDDIRAQVLRACNYTCGLCGKKPKRKGKLHLDHIRPRVQFPELEYAVSNLQALCATCNQHKQAYDGDDWVQVTKQRLSASRKKKAALRKQSGQKRL